MAGAATIYSAIISVMIVLLILTASSLTKNARFAGMLFAIYVVGSFIVASIVHGLQISENWLAVSPMVSVTQVGLKLFRMDLMREISLTASVVSVLAHWAACALILKWKLSRAARYGR